MNFREEPVAFFFILFGLAFEALVMQSREDPSQTLSILQALKKILKPAVCGTAIYQDVVFNETTDALDRLAMTSKFDTQSVLVEVSRNLSLNHISANGDVDRNEKLSDDIDQLFELTRIIVLVLTGLVPTLDDPHSTSTRAKTEEAVTLVQNSFKALVDVAEVFPSVIRADLHACIMHCFCTILATGTCQADVVPQIIPTFRAFVQVITASKSDDSGRLVRGCLMRLLMILSHAQRRENEFALLCAKSTLLSITILLTTASSVISPGDTLVAKSVSEILDCLQDIGLAKVAANCIRSLLLSNQKTPCDEVIGRLLYPKLLHFVGDPEADDPETVKSTIAQAMITSVSAMPRRGRYAAASILITALLNGATKESPNGSTESKEKETAARLLELAAMDPEVFRAIVVMLKEEQRTFLESILRSVGAGNRGQDEVDDDVDIKPTIELRMDFD
jgi:HEAT repeat-containing protein 5